MRDEVLNGVMELKSVNNSPLRIYRLGCERDVSVIRLFVRERFYFFRKRQLREYLFLLGGVEVLHQELSAEWARAKSVHANVLAGVDRGELLGHCYLLSD